MLFTTLLALHIVLALFLIAIILLQQGKGATAGAAFGSGASSTVFGARGSASFLTRLTAVLAILFFSNSMVLAYMYSQAVKPQSLLDQVAHNPQPVVEQPASADLPADFPPATIAVDDLPQLPPAAPPAATPAVPDSGDLPPMPAADGGPSGQ